MNKQIITVEPSGQISGLQRKAGQGLNLQTMGTAKTERVSEITWAEDAQAWTVEPVRGPYAGAVLSAAMWVAVVGTEAPEGLRGGTITDAGVLYFDDYDLAVKAEIAFLDAARARGVF